MSEDVRGAVPQSSPSGPELASSPTVWAFRAAVVACFAYIAFLLSLPCFPSTDGPVHMYYVHVLSALLSHSDPLYARYFHVRHLLPPYSLYYYALLVLSRYMSILLADKLVICAYFVSFVFGFRYLARAIGPSADLTTLLATLLLLNWPLGMGFVNFCLSLSFSFWATGLWLRILGTGRTRARIGFLVLVTAIMLTHPVPLLLLLAVCGTVLAVRLLHARTTDPGHALPEHWKADVLTLLVAALNLGYVKLFAAGNPLKQVNETSHPLPPYLVDLLIRVQGYGREHALAFLFGRGADLLIYRFGLIVLLLLPFLLALHQRRRNRAAHSWTVGDTFLLIGGISFVGLPFIPSQLNGLYYFADRLVICVWLAFLLAASGWSALAGKDVFSPMAAGDGQQEPQITAGLPIASGTATAVCVLFVAVTTAAVLHGANRLLRPAAIAIAAFDAQAVRFHHQLGFVLQDERDPTEESSSGVSWNPYYWAPIHLLRHNDAILANAPWMHESIIPVAPSDPLPEVSIKALQQPFPKEAVPTFRAAPEDLRATLQAVSFYVVDQHGRPPLETLDPLLALDPAARSQWICATGQQPWSRLCERSPGALPAAGK